MHINDLKKRTSYHLPRIMRATNRVLSSGRLVLGSEVQAFEAAFAQYLGVSHCIGVANGSDAIELALIALNISQGSRVALVGNAGMYSSIAVMAVGAQPIYIDVDFITGNVTSEAVESVIALGVDVVIITHLYGLAVAETSKIADLCLKAKIPLIEDCAQAHGASVDGRKVGSFGVLGTFSFYPTKNLGALGDGGAIATNDVSLAEKIYSLRQYGWGAKYNVVMAGGRNSRLDELQAAILLEFLPELEATNALRRNIASKYNALIRAQDLNVTLPTWSDEEYVAHLYVIKTPQRDRLQEHLAGFDIFAEVHYPVPDYRQIVFGEKYSNLMLVNTDRLAKEVLTLPCYPEMSMEQVDGVVDAVNSFDKKMT
jgi:dTDP-3-amino-2,3,6-trideoxy-4-keto-D-glucose/dTDP-3-amino-3,4,6-trideoxy-alpha-D-glucose/dTDP-2,6-dideoxy-D-kanosamine transaminase